MADPTPAALVTSAGSGTGQPPPAAPTALVTGASSGIGRATTQLLAAHGYTVLAAARNPADLDELCAATSAVRPVQLDVTDGAAAAALATQLADAGGRLDALVNNAGVALPGALMDLEAGELRHQLEVNLIGVHRVTQACFPLLQAAQGRVVNVSSTSGLLAMPFVGAYSASKFALEAYSDALRRELRPLGVTVSVVQPGAVRTAIWDKAEAAVADQRLALSPFAARARGFARIMLERAASGARPPEAIAAVIYRALRSRRPAPRYLATEANGMTRVLAALPDRWLDALLERMLRRSAD